MAVTESEEVFVARTAEETVSEIEQRKKIPLDSEILDHRLDDEVCIGHRSLQVTEHLYAAHCLAGVTLRDLAAGYPTLEVFFDPRRRRFEHGSIAVGEGRLVARQPQPPVRCRAPWYPAPTTATLLI